MSPTYGGSWPGLAIPMLHPPVRAFIIRNNKIRVISARDMSRTERDVYEDLKKNAKKLESQGLSSQADS